MREIFGYAYTVVAVVVWVVGVLAFGCDYKIVIIVHTMVSIVLYSLRAERVLQGLKKLPRKNLIYRVFLSAPGDFTTPFFVSTVVKKQQ